MPPAFITNDAVILGLLAMPLGAVFWTASRTDGFWKKFYSDIPSLLMCYLIPALLNTFGTIDGNASGVYAVVRDYLPPSAVMTTTPARGGRRC